MLWRKWKNEKNSVNRDLVTHISSLEMEITNYRDKVQNLERLSKQKSEELRRFKNNIAFLKQMEDEERNMSAKDVLIKETESQRIKSLMEELEEEQKETREITIQVLMDEANELKKRLLIYVEKMQKPLDHYEFALSNYKDKCIPIKAPRINGYDRREIERLLPQEVKNTKKCITWAKIQKDFGYSCAITGVKHYDFEHFIPIHTGHGGAYEGNIIPMRWQLNSKKGKKNPFHWFRESQQRGVNISIKRWDNLIGYLAEKHDLSVEDYFEFVNWCFANPRTKEQLQMVNTPSLELWKHAKTIII